jgi:trimeric autotransporter adhesin
VNTLAGLFMFFLAGLVSSSPLAAQPAGKTYTIQSVAGNDLVGDGGLAGAAILTQAQGIAVYNGAIFVADAAANRVRKISPDGTIQTVAGTGASGFSGDGGSGNAAMLDHPYGLAVDTNGNLFIADLGNARVRKLSANGTIQTVAGGGLIPARTNGDNNPALGVQFEQPRNVAIDPDGTLYISDFGANRVYRVSPGGNLTTLAGTGSAGLTGDGASAVMAQLKSPAGLASDSLGNVYICDSGNNRIRKVSRGIITTAFTVVGPTGIAINLSSTLYIAAAAYFGTQFRAIAGVASPQDVALDITGNAYATTGQQVLKITADGRVTPIAGSATSAFFGGDNGPATSARLHAPTGIVVDELGNWYVADSLNNRIRKVTSGGGISTIAGTGVAGFGGDGAQATLATLNGPRGVALDAQHNLYVADTGNNRIRKITPDGNISTAAAGFNAPEYLIVTADGALNVADTGNNRVLKVLPTGSTTVIVQVLKPTALAIDPSGNFLVSELTRVSKVSPSGVVTTVLDGLNSPRGLAPTQDGDLLIAEMGFHRIVRLSASGVVSTIAGTGVAGPLGDGGLATVAQLNAPADLMVDLSGKIWIADSGNNRIRTLTPDSVGSITAEATVLNAASGIPGPIAPGEIVSIFGSGFDPATAQVFFGAKAGTIFYAGANQLNVLVPSDLAPDSNTEILIKGQRATTVADFSTKVAAAAPGIFTTSNGTGQAAANNEDGTVNSTVNPIARGSIIVLYATGEGQNIESINLTIGGTLAELLFAGHAPGFPGLMQINARVPGGAGVGGSLTVSLGIGTAVSQGGVTIAVRAFSH